MANNSNAAISGARYSAINSMHYCRLWAWMTYREKRQGYKNPFAKLGIVIHNVLEDYGKYCVENKVDTDYAKFDEIKYKYLHELQESQIQEALSILENIKNNFNWSSYNEFEIVDLEQRYAINNKLEITNDPNPYLSGGIDLIYIDGDTAYIVDYKTVRAIYTRQYMKDSLQRRIYALLVMKKYPQVQTTKFAFNFVRYGYQSEYFDIHREELETLEPLIQSEVEALISLLNEEEPPEPSAGDHCILCESRANCPAYKNAFVEIEQITSENEAKILYGAYKLAKIRVSNMEKILKLWIETNQNIRLKYEEYGPKEYEKIEFNDTKKLIELLQGAGVAEGAIFDELNMSNTKVKKLCKKFKLSDDKQKELEKIASKSKYTKYTTIKLSDETDEDEDEVIVDQYL
jgi:hypothetical protein